MKSALSQAIGIALAATLGFSQVQAAALSDIYELARNNDPQLQSAQAESLAGQQAVPLNRAALLPSVTLTGQISRTDTGNAKTSYSNGMTLSLSQAVFDLTKWYNLERAKTLTEKAKLGLAAAEQGLILRTLSAYMDVLRAQSTLEVAKSKERALQRRLDQVNAQFDVGLIAITDVLEARASYDSARVELIDAEGTLDNSYEAIERLTGQTVSVIDKLSPDYPIMGVDQDQKAWIEKALSSNLELRVAKLNEQAATENVKAYGAAGLPTLSLGISAKEGNDRYQSFDNSIGLTLSVPLFLGGYTTAAEQQAQYQGQQAMHDYEDASRKVTQQTRTLLRDISTSLASVNARMKSIESREKALEATSQGFEVGTRNVVDVLDAENALYQARLAYADARIGHIATLFNFKQMVGTLSPEDIYTLDQWLKP